MTLPILTGALGMLLLDIHFNTLYFDSTDDIRGVGSIIYTSSNQAIAISKSNNPLNMCLFIILFNYFYYNYHYV